jgi:hypothetical protein
MQAFQSEASVSLLRVIVSDPVTHQLAMPALGLVVLASPLRADSIGVFIANSDLIFVLVAT